MILYYLLNGSRDRTENRGSRILVAMRQENNFGDGEKRTKNKTRSEGKLEARRQASSESPGDELPPERKQFFNS